MSTSRLLLFVSVFAPLAIGVGCSSAENSSQGAGGSATSSTSSSGSTTPSSGSSASASSSSSSSATSTSSSGTTSSSSTSSGQVSMCGAPSSPAWLVGHQVNEWFEIPGTGGAAGVDVQAYSGLALRESNSEIVIAAAGGHHDSADNRVVSLVLSADSPTWVMRSASSANPVENVEYYPDGLPSSRHLYHSSHIIESRHRVFLFGARGVWGDGYDYSTVVDAFDLDTNKWDPAGTWDRIPSAGGYGAVHVRATDDVFTTGLFQWSAATASWSQPITQFSGDNVRWPIAYDSLRNQLFSLQWADGQGFGDMKINASKVPLPGPTQLTVSFNPSPALTQFQADAPTYSGLDYDPDNDRFLFYCGQAGGEGRVYVVTPNATSTWDMSILPLDPGSVKPPTVTGSGVYSRFRYVPQLKGFLLLPDNTNNIFFLRTC